MKREKVKCPSCGRWIPMYATSCICELNKEGKMKEEKTKPLSFVKEFTHYFILRGMRVLRLKLAGFHHVCIDIHPSEGTIWVWFHTEERIIARAQFTFDGKCYNKVDNRDGK